MAKSSILDARFAFEGTKYYSNWLMAILFTFYRKWLAKFRIPMKLCKWGFQILGLAVAIWAGTYIFGQILPAATMQEISVWTAQGLFAQTNQVGFENGSTCVAFLLLFLYGIGTFLSLNKAVYLADALMLYMLFFSINYHEASQALAMVGFSLVVVIWLVHRIVLAALAVFYKRNEQLKIIEGEE